MKIYRLKEYIELLRGNGLLKDIINCDDILNEEINLVSHDSKEAKENTLFIVKGANFKKEYLKDALESGTLAYVSETDEYFDTPRIIVKDIRAALSCISKMYYNSPEDNLNIIGIGGTKGKSTTSCYIKSILDTYKQALNKKDTAIISSINTYDGVLNYESHITTPESLELQKHFSNAVNSGLEDLVMEVSSQALKYDRVKDVTFDIGIFMNISIDHISPIEHPDFEDYYNSKLKMFKNTKKAIVNMDADYAENTLNVAKRDSEAVYTFGINNKNTDIYAYDIRKDGFNTVFKVHTPTYDEEFTLTMPGLFNVENALAAISTAYIMNVPVRFIKEGLRIARSEGRMELYHTDDMNVVALVDYAHNKLSFEKLFSSVKEEYPEYKIVSIFGCPGKKALLRRKDLGLIAGANSNHVYIVSEDPGEEPVLKISSEIAEYVKLGTHNYSIIESREEAIIDAFNKARKTGDKTILLITGKGRETRQKYGTTYIPCKSDVEITLEQIEEYNRLIKEGTKKLQLK